MNRLGMMVDISHASDETFYDVLEVSQTPVIASHSCARAICRQPAKPRRRHVARSGQERRRDPDLHPGWVCQESPAQSRTATRRSRNLRATYGNSEDLTEDQKRERFEKWEEINRKYPQSNATVSDVVDHIDHVVKVVGIDYVGIGTDFDGGGGVSGLS